MDIKEQISRWRLILGQESENRFSGMTALSLTQEQDLMDQALASIYNRTELGGFGNGKQGASGAGKGPSNPQITRWLGDVRTLFDKELVTVIQIDFGKYGAGYWSCIHNTDAERPDSEAIQGKCPRVYQKDCGRNQ